MQEYKKERKNDMNGFVYDIPTRIYFGQDQLCHLGDELKKYGKKVLVAYGGGSIKKSGLYDKVMAQISAAGLYAAELSGIEPNPKIDSVRRGAELCKQENIDMVLAVGGGSTIDAAKFIAAGACADIDPWEFIKNRAPIERALPVITVLTIAATGSEMDNCGVISNPETNDKIGRGDYKLVPKASFLDPTVTYSVSAYQTACGAADIISHICEVYFNTEKDLYMLDGFMEVLFKTVIKYAPIAIAKPDDYEARANLMWASSWAINGFLDGGRTLAWSCHPMEHQLSAYYDITHGLGLAILTPRWMRHCLNDATAPRLARFARTVFSVDNALDDGGDVGAVHDDNVQVNDELSVPGADLYAPGSLPAAEQLAQDTLSGVGNGHTGYAEAAGCRCAHQIDEKVLGHINGSQMVFESYHKQTSFYEKVRLFSGKREVHPHGSWFLDEGYSYPYFTRKSPFCQGKTAKEPLRHRIRDSCINFF